MYGDNFVFYDINDPLGNHILQMAKHDFDFVLADPPFWLEEYLDKLLVTVDYLATKDAKILVCAGPPMMPYMLSKKFKTCTYRPTYERRLCKYPSNQSRVYSNYGRTVQLDIDNSTDEITYSPETVKK